MSTSHNFSRARSHIVFIVALLSAAAYILWVEQSRGVPAAVPGVAETWSTQIGTFDTAEAAGRAWDRLRAQGSTGDQRPIVLLESAGLFQLRIAGHADRGAAERVCRYASATGLTCAVTPHAS